MKKLVLILPLIAILIGMLFNVLFTGASAQLDQADGGNAQQIYAAVPTISGTPEYDIQYAEIYKRYSEGNKNNAEGDASTTLANAQATQTYILTWLTVLITVAGVGAGIVLLDKVLKS